jgi:ATP-binding cassette subfamily A (ABC1) protein 3
MEEADMLGDNIVIMKRGQFCCYGTSLHLKNKFGSGYRMTIVTENDNQIPAVTENVKQELPEATMSRTSPGTIHFEVPVSMEEKLIEFLRNTEVTGQKLGIVDVQVGMTSLEDVFLKVAGLEAEISEAELEAEEEKEVSN